MKHKIPKLVNLITGSLYSLNHIFRLPLPLAPGNHHSILYFSEFDHFRLHTYVRSYGICLSLSDLFHLAQCLQVSSNLSQMAGFPSFSLAYYFLTCCLLWGSLYILGSILDMYFVIIVPPVAVFSFSLFSFFFLFFFFLSFFFF